MPFVHKFNPKFILFYLSIYFYRIMHDPKRHIIASRDLGKIIGVTLEIFEVGSDEDHQGEFCCKARVTQRFRVLDCVSSGR
jgi:hypothetical protein